MSEFSTTKKKNNKLKSHNNKSTVFSKQEVKLENKLENFLQIKYYFDKKNKRCRKLAFLFNLLRS